MEKVHSFEQRSISEIGYEHDLKQNRIIVSNRRDPNVDWSTQNQPIQSRNYHWRSNVLRWLRSIIYCNSNFSSFGSRESRRTRSNLSNGGQVDEGPFPSNEWLTSKYTLFNFIPKNLFEQFRRLANFYFLIMAILQYILPYSPVGPATSLLPLLFVVCTSAIKQAYEDYLRHKLDREVNNRQFHVLKNKKLTKVRSKDIRVGDIVYVRNNEEIPCDMILLAVSGQGDKCYITTANLDGETSLKGRTCYQVKDQLGTIEKLDDTLLAIECERPNPTLYEFNGYLRAPKDVKAYDNLVTNLKANTRGKEYKDMTIIQMIMKRLKPNKSNISSTSKSGKSTADLTTDYLLNSDPPCYEIPLDIGNLLLRASRLRNTSHIYGMAVYTGRDTKLAHNSLVKPNKFSSLENKVNIFLTFAFILLIGFSLIGAILYERPLERLSEAKEEPNSFGEVFMAYFLLYNYLVPISLYVTLEFVKFIGTMSVVKDKKMRITVFQTLNQESNNNNNKLVEQKQTNTTMDSSITSMSSSRRIKVLEGPRCNSSDLNEELGQVEVLFSDKTGTLTENKMRFMACSFHGQLYRSIHSQLYLQPAELYKAPIPDVVKNLATVDSARYSTLVPQMSRHHHSGHHAANGVTKSHTRSTNTSNPANKPFDHRIIPPLDSLKLINNIDQHEGVVEFFICLCLCSTITINEALPLSECLPDRTMNEYDFQSASPDEESLISAAHQYGIKMCKSNDKECFIVIERSKSNKNVKSRLVNSTKQQANSPKGSKTPLKPKIDSKKEFHPLAEGEYSTDKYIIRHFERLIVFEFSSARKRMSAIYRDCDSDCIIMVSKGSEELLDCVNLTKLTGEKERAINATLAHFEAFALSGLRTLLVAKRTLDDREFEKIESELKEARMSIQNRDHMMNKLYQRAEVNMKLIGATAVEDTLQDGVPETIASLKEAGIKVWLLTGDKVETAISVAYLCKLLDREMTLFHLVRQQDVQACKKLLATFRQQLQEANQDLPPDGADQTLTDVYVTGQVKKASLHLKSSTKSPKSPKSSLRSPKSRANSKNSKTQVSKLSNEHVKNSILSVSNEEKGTTTREKFALIADGRSLYYAMKYAREELAQLCKECTCVLGCRLSPLQKSEVVFMIKNDPTRPITAAIGDGANDVSMIQEAHVGIGVSGKEGRQAINSSDFAISKFSMLNRLFFIHGHLFYHRTANTIHYFFYKNLLFVLPQFLHSLYNLSKVASLYQPILLISFNLFFTSLPVLTYGLYEMHIPETILENHPNLYKLNKHNSQMSLWVFFSWLCLAFFQASIGFYTLYYNWNSPFLEAGKTKGINGFALIIYFTIVTTVIIKLYFLSNHHTILFNCSSLGSILILPIFFYLYSLFDWTSILDDNSFYGATLEYLGLPIFWTVIGVTTLAAILPDIMWYIRNRLLYFQKLNNLVKVNNIEK